MSVSAPTYAQLEQIYRWLFWNMPTELAHRAVAFLRNNKTRAEVSTEMNRLYKLYHARTLTQETCFEGKIWEGFTVTEDPDHA